MKSFKTLSEEARNQVISYIDFLASVELTPAIKSDEEKKGRGRPKKAEDIAAQPKRGRGRPKKVAAEVPVAIIEDTICETEADGVTVCETEVTVISAEVLAEVEAPAEVVTPVKQAKKPKGKTKQDKPAVGKKATRKKTMFVENVLEDAVPKRGRGRPMKTQ